MTIRILEIIRHRTGWCPHARALPAAPVLSAPSPAMGYPESSPGGSGGQGRIDRGFSLAVGSIRILIRNRRLLWFSLLTGLVMIFGLVGSLYLQYISGTYPLPGTGLFPAYQEALITKGSLPWFALTFIVTLVNTFLTYCLFAGLVVCTAGILSGSTVSVREGLSRAGNYIRPLAYWAAIGAAIGTVVSFISNSYTADFALALLIMMPAFAFFVITLYVIPAIILNDKSLVPSIRNSLSAFRKTWVEIITCFCIFFLIAFLISLTSLIPMIAIVFSADNPALAQAGTVVAIYMLVMMGIVFIGSTVVGIATVGLYTFGKTGTLPAAFEKSGGG